ncbi:MULTISPECIES: hypothetical protein [Achromobacter]|uniref:hypothetical protein n=1 Tax=Achromobacter TaxID=222 RepID=UPI000761DD96|nr:MULTISPECIES: hypothetical protein [Achromobacter]KWU18088.1 hypothetical protein AS148_14555 [Achromobacter xylosoxidans]PWY49183.1 hypothetical protein DK459_11695 [Achromobacter sp. RW408]
MSKIENTWRLAPVAAAQHELAEVRAALGFLPQGYTAMAGLERLADLLAAAEPSPTSPAVSTEQDAPITVTVDHDPRGVSVGVWQGSHCIYSGAHPIPTSAGDVRPVLPPLNDDLADILGRPNFWCADLAELLRADGREIKRKSEHEQAAVIHFLLGHYLQHGSDWRETAGSALDAIAAHRKRDA